MIGKYIVKSSIIHLCILLAILLSGLVGTLTKKPRPKKNIITFDFVKIGPVSTAHNNIACPNSQQSAQKKKPNSTTAKQSAKQQPPKSKKQDTQNKSKTNTPTKQIPKKNDTNKKIQDTKKQESQTKKQEKNRTTKQDLALSKTTKSKTSDNIATNADKVGGVLTATQADVIKQRLYNTWNIPIGIRNINDISVDVRIELNRDGYVTNIKILKISHCHPKDADIIEKSIYRALYSDKFSPLPFDKKSHNNWKVIDLCFYPGDMV